MIRTLYLFNPDHDLALANGDENFNAPLSALRFAGDLACLPVWYALPDSVVSGNEEDVAWFSLMCSLFPALAKVAVLSKSEAMEMDRVSPWGWNISLRKSLQAEGFEVRNLPDESRLEAIRRLSHRITAIKAMEFLGEEPCLTHLIPPPARLLSAEEVETFVAGCRKVVLKAPWSGSGKGIRWVDGYLSASTEGWCRNIIRHQGILVGEEVYDKVQDFAMEFSCQDGKADFVGYSLFHAENGVYKSNELLSDEAILARLTDRWISPIDLDCVRRRILLFVEKEISPFYTGFLGIDMFVYQRDGMFLLHPCVEINLRMTMGLVARIFYDRFVHPGKTGVFYIDHFTSQGELLTDHAQRLENMPLSVSDGKITKGYLSLNPLTGLSQYRARVEIG